MIRALALVAPLVVGTASISHADTTTADVTYEIYNFYNPSQPLDDSSMRVTAHNNTTGVSYTADQRGGNEFTLPVGNYTFSGRGQWCYLQPKTVNITGDTDVQLLAGCE